MCRYFLISSITYLLWQEQIIFKVRVLKFFGLVVHHGIDLGDGTGIHFFKKIVGSKPIIARTYLTDFGDGLPFDIVRHTSYLPDDEVINRAMWLLWCFKNGYAKRYDMFENNCEHIANWCKADLYYSGQAETAKSIKEGVNENRWEIADIVIQALGEIG